MRPMGQPVKMIATRVRLMTAGIVIALFSTLLLTTPLAGGQSSEDELSQDAREAESTLRGIDIPIRDLGWPSGTEASGDEDILAELAVEPAPLLDAAVDAEPVRSYQSDLFQSDLLGAQMVAVSGNVMWQVPDKKTNAVWRIPVAFAEVRLFDKSDSLLGTTTTDENGNFTLNVAAGKTGVYAIAYTWTENGAGPVKVLNATVGGVDAVPYELRSSQTVSTTRGTPPSLEVVNTASSEANRAFSVYQALVLGFKAFEDLLPDGQELKPVHAYYPLTNTSYISKRSAVTISRDDVWDWDVIHHELAHHVGVTTKVHVDFDDGVDTTHLIGGNLTESSSRTPQQSLALAWAEGWATYAAISVQQVLNNDYPALSHIPTFGNLVYEDPTYDQALTNSEISFSLDEPELAASTASLPDNEMVVARFLHTLNPSTTGRSYQSSSDQWLMRDLFEIASQGEITDAFNLWQRLNVNRSLDTCVADDFGFIPRPLSNAINIADTSASTRVIVNGIGPDYPNRNVIITFVSESGAVLDSISTAVSPSSTATAVIDIDIPDAKWAALKRQRVASWRLSAEPALPGFAAPGCERDLVNGTFANLSIEPICQAGTGALAGTLTNFGDDTGQYRIEVTENAPQLQASNVEFERVVEPGASATIAVNDLTDGDYTVSVSSTTGATAGTVSTQKQAEVNCNAERKEYERRDSCLAANGRVDVSLTNIYSHNAKYTITVDDDITRTLWIESGAKKRATVVGLDEGAHRVTVQRGSDATPLVDEPFFVTCDKFFTVSDPVDIRAWCENARGRVSVYARNDENVGSDFVVTTGGVRGGKAGFAPAGGTALMEFRLVPDGKYAFVIERNGTVIGRKPVTIDCS